MTHRPRRVYKVGGPALEDPALLAPLAHEIRTFAGDVAVVHGGGRQVERLLKRLDLESQFVDGRRVTTAAAMEVVEMVLSGAMNKALSAGLASAGLRAVGLSGRDGGFIRATLRPDLGQVGSPATVEGAVIEALWAASFVPVISPVSSGPSGEAVNVNADEAAQAVTRGLGAETLVFLSDVDGVILDGKPVEHLDEATIAARTADGAIRDGMAMKVRMALDAVRSGIPTVVIAGPARLSGAFPGTRISLA